MAPKRKRSTAEGMVLSHSLNDRALIDVDNISSDAPSPAQQDPRVLDAGLTFSSLYVGSNCKLLPSLIRVTVHY